MPDLVLKHAAFYTEIHDKTMNTHLEKQAVGKLAIKDGKALAVGSIRESGGRPSPSERLAYVKARCPHLFAEVVEEVVQDDAPAPTNGVAVA